MDNAKNISTMAPPKKKRRKVASLDKKKAKAGWWFILPFLFGFVTVYVPIVYRSIIYSISDKANASGQIIGFENYIHILTEDENFTKTLTGGIQQLVFDIPAIVIFSLFMAVLLNQKVLGRAVFRAIFFVPVILGTGLIDELDSLANPVLDNMQQQQGATDGGTGTSATEIISTYDLAKLFEGMKVGTELVEYVTDLVNNIYGIINRSGVQLLIFLSGLQSISPAIYESCSIDGAPTWDTFWKIAFPMISPMILVNTVYTVIDAFTSQGNSVIRLILGTQQQPIAAAMAWVYFLIVLVLIGAVSAFVYSFVFYQRRD